MFMGVEQLENFDLPLSMVLEALTDNLHGKLAVVGEATALPHYGEASPA